MDTITNWLTPFVGGKGFARERSEYSECFTRIIPGGRQFISMIVEDYRPLVKISLLAEVRLDVIERVFHLFSGISPEHQGLSSTIVTPFHYFTGGPSEEEAREAEELLAILGTWEECLHAKVFPYLDTAIDVVSLDRYLHVNRDIFDVMGPPFSFMHHIIVAKLANNPEYYDLISLHISELRYSGYETELYDKLVDYLSTQE